MIDSSAYNYINVLGKAASASAMRQNVISNNIANVDTPNFKRQDVSFETYLNSALGGYSNLDDAVDNMRVGSINPTSYTDNSSLSYRLDGNNVDIQTENAYLAQNQIRYYTLLDSMNQEFSRLNTAIKGE